MTNVIAKKPVGCWWLRLANGMTLQFYEGTPDQHPFDTVPEFDHGDTWSVDAGYGQDLPYPEDPSDNSFMLIPKRDVVEVYFQAF